jgi:activator of HSP90 ATPase
VNTTLTTGLSQCPETALTCRHWVSKNCLSWAKDYFQTELTKLSAEDGSNKVAVKKLSSCEGDVDVSQRKGKIITLFDVKLVLDIEGCPSQVAVGLTC